jgi:two-component system response regulator AtoC
VETETNTARMLLVSRDPSTVLSLSKVGEANAWLMETVQSGLQALEHVQSKSSPDLVLLDLAPDDADSLHTLRWLRRVCPHVPVILLSQSENHRDMVEALRLGAQDFLIKPWQEQQLDLFLKTQLAESSHIEAPAVVEKISDSFSLVAASPSMKKLRAQAELLAQVNVPVLIVGEPGTGRETTARLIHKLSVRAATRFLKLNCDITNERLEQELFGDDRHSISGGVINHPGKLELCHRGTLLLEEVPEMSSALQARVLNAMHRPTGNNRNDNGGALDVRILGTAEADGEAIDFASNGKGELLRRLGAFTIHVPALRQRKEDLSILLAHTMKRLAHAFGLPPRTFSASALEACQHYAWPGNLRELENFVKCHLMLGDESLLMVSDGALQQENSQALERAIRMRIESLKQDGNDEGMASRARATEVASLKALVRNAKEEAERGAIAGALEQTHWNRKAAARLLQVSYRALLYKIDEYQMTPQPRIISPTQHSPGKGNPHGNY